MRAPTAILDLSNIAVEPGTNGERASWRRVEDTLAVWRSDFDARAVFYGVADRSLLHKLDKAGTDELRGWQRAGRAQIVPWADPIVCELAERSLRAFVISNDNYKGLRGRFPYLQGCDRFYSVEFSAMGTPHLRQRRLAVLGAEMISAAREDEDKTPFHLREAEGQALLRFEWACVDALCVRSVLPALEELPFNDHGVAKCPGCGGDLRKVALAKSTAELKLVVDGNEVERIPLSDGAAVVIGRGAGPAIVDVREFMAEEAVGMISRRHVEVTNRSGRLLARDLGSRNGSQIVRAGDTPAALASDVPTVMSAGTEVVLAGGLSLKRSGKRYPRGEYVPVRSHPDAGPTEMAT